ncbi:uncharacterized protein LOC130498625 isoform X3 [Raphanus sativus]|uniref:Uncharacterized protein LOC130498625 isoform X3 n=1 Tax=Raphanus sativus TaxID=3726 RepID=A0A9W3C9H8_RAPSA|nr:uncharacterized protein LOC130498625 isoform X3 [Raphanus sativus]
MSYRVSSILLLILLDGSCLPSGFASVCDHHHNNELEEVFRCGIERKCHHHSLFPRPPSLEVDGDLLDSVLSEQEKMRISLLLSCLLVSTCLFTSSSSQSAGFVSLDCGGTEPFTDEHGLNWTPDDHLLYGSMYLTGVEDKFHLSVAARINFGAETEDPVRYPDDPYDRIWESDLLKKANCVSKNPQIRGCWDCTICSVFVNHEQMPTTYITCPVSIYNKMV